MFIPEHSPHPSHPATGPDDLYAAKPPWDIDRPQPAFLTLAEDGQIRGRVLDIGCGTGEHALMAAGLGHDAVGVDQSAHALELAERKARDRGITVTFIRYDACKLADLGETFDTVLDCGLFHIFSDAARSQYVDSLHGNNVALRELVGQEGPDYARKNLHFALLEFWSMRTADEEVLARESYWKDVLLSRKFGLNKN